MGAGVMQKEHCYFVYILSNKRRRLYIGVTNSLVRRVGEHKCKADPDSFTARYGIDRLVYFQRFQYIQDAIRRETEIKGWLRTKKIALIVETNPTWRDLSEDFGQSIERFDESKMRPPERF